MKRITKTMIEEHFGPQKRISRTMFGAWWVELQSGASVKITRNRIDFGKYKDVKSRADIDEGLFQEEVWASNWLGEEAWGGVSAYGGASQEDTTTFISALEEAGIDTGDQGLMLRHFGPKATVKFGWLGGFTITLPDHSFVKFEGGAIEEVRGGGDLFRAALKLIYEIAPDNVVVRGKPDLLVMGVEHGKALGIEVIPEDPLKVFCAVSGAIMQLTCMALAGIWLDLWEAVFAGYIAGIAICIIGGRLFWRQLRAAARRRGLAIKGLDHTTHDASRKASLDDAKSRGML
jgi:hypothetical protein